MPSGSSPSASPRHRQVQELIDAGVPGIHFYVLNKSHATAAVLSAVKRPV